MSDIVRIGNITRQFGSGASGVTALKSVSLRLAPGDFTAIRGPSGCGKTTLLLTAGGLLRPDAGQISVLGTSLYDLSQEQRAFFRARHIGFVFQQFHLIPYLTVRENVIAPLVDSNRTEGDQRVDALLQRFTLAEHGEKLPAALSTGERQRAAIARALINQPRLLLADEPTGNLDEDNAAVVLDALSGFAREGGAVLLVTHDRNAASYAHATVTMRAGSLYDKEQI